jgi:hypothetical protein
MIELQAPPLRQSSALSRPLNVFNVDPHSDSRWQEFVLAHPEGTVYHHPKWIRVVEQEYGQRSEHLACTDKSGNFLAIMPMLYTRGLPFGLGGSTAGKRLSSLPRTPLAGPLSCDRDATAALLRAAVAKTGQEPGTQIQIKAFGEQLDGLINGLVTTPWRLCYVLTLPDPSKGPFRIADGQERAKVKWAINKAAKLGVTVRTAESKTDLRRWYRVYLETMRRNAVPPRSYRFFSALWDAFQPCGMMELLLAELPEGDQKTVIAGSIFLTHGSTVSYVFNGMDRKHSSLRANDAIQWNAINAACERGFRFFDFGEVPEGHTELARFKSKWGAQPTRMHRYALAANPTPNGTSDESSGRIQSLVEQVWRRLPLGVTAQIGDWLYSYL